MHYINISLKLESPSHMYFIIQVQILHNRIPAEPSRITGYAIYWTQTGGLTENGQYELTL